VNGRSLAWLNAAGCLVLSALVVLQWRKELTLDGRIQQLQSQLVAARDQVAAGHERVGMMERDQELLKESIASMQQAADAAAKQLALRDGQVAELEARLVTLDSQINTWQAAINQRDERIRTLDADLTSARRRLDEAIAKLKADGAR
jgi:predicted  nucleic acid-binding Zn-ribbon protein